MRMSAAAKRVFGKVGAGGRFWCVFPFWFLLSFFFFFFFYLLFLLNEILLIIKFIGFFPRDGSTSLPGTRVR